MDDIRQEMASLEKDIQQYDQTLSTLQNQFSVGLDALQELVEIARQAKEQDSPVYFDKDNKDSMSDIDLSTPTETPMTPQSRQGDLGRNSPCNTKANQRNQSKESHNPYKMDIDSVSKRKWSKQFHT